jgi:hypothetical protein
MGGQGNPSIFLGAGRSPAIPSQFFSDGAKHHH